MKLWYGIVKRLLDDILCLAALVLLSPIFLFTAIAIKLEDGGKVFYTQKRVGKDEKVFNMYKFRSMRVDADKIHADMALEMGNTEVTFKPKDDPRVTKVGRFIRHTSIDELPQLVNILKGEMAIVGPRPLPVYEYEEERARYGTKYQDRYSVHQGLTCYWQITGRGEDMPFDERMTLDVTYAQDVNLITDTKLVLRTFGVVITGKGSY